MRAYRFHLATITAVCLIGTTWSFRVSAQQRAPLIVDISPCTAVESVLERLQCYDDLARTAARQAAVTAPAPDESPTDRRPAGSAAAAAVVEAGAAEDRFGFPPERESRRAGREAEDEIRSEVSALREIVPGQLEITLTNGQVWRQTNSDRYQLQVGHPVRVYPTRFGQYYRLTSEILRGFVQVERIR